MYLNARGWYNLGMKKQPKPAVGIIMGSNSDLPVMEGAAKVLEEFGVHYDMTVVSAHRTPDRLVSYARSAEKRGLKIIIAGAGGAAHLPGMTASMTELPVIGVPVRSKMLDGLDSLLSIVQMPPGVPVATMAIDGARNAGLFAIRILAVNDPVLSDKLFGFHKSMQAAAKKKIK